MVPTTLRVAIRVRNCAKAAVRRPLRARVAGGFAAGELAVALMLPVGADLLVRSIIALDSRDFGFATSQVLALGLGSRPGEAFASRQFLRSGENKSSAR
jgi:hypothetical protein